MFVKRNSVTITTKERIFETALDLFAEKGYEATSIRDITKAVGLSVAAFYNHFASKNELLQAIYNFYRSLDTTETEAKPDLEQMVEQMSPFDIFDKMAQQIIETLHDEKLVKLTRIIINEQYTNATAGEIASKDRQALLSSMVELFSVMASRGKISVKEPEALGRLVGYMYLGFAEENIHASILGTQDPTTVINNQLRLIHSFLQGFIVEAI
ncbi:MAG TPA: helix-turn-helix domain-containing protein [Candidatus Limiplasma sp.]|nr:helix-turn-helix domain-containing protein [Candidatus Limiplasma sp.]